MLANCTLGATCLCQSRRSPREFSSCLKCLFLALYFPKFSKCYNMGNRTKDQPTCGQSLDVQLFRSPMLTSGRNDPFSFGPSALLCLLCPLTAIYLLPNDSLCHGKLSSLQISPEKGSLSVCPSDKAKRGRSVCLTGSKLQGFITLLRWSLEIIH